jgi:hypothetical protein
MTHQPTTASTSPTPGSIPGIRLRLSHDGQLKCAWHLLLPPAPHHLPARPPPARLDQEYQNLHILHKALKADCQEARRAREIAETKMTTMDQQQRELMVRRAH